MRRIPLRNRLITRLLLSHIFLAAVPIMVVGWVLITTAQRSIKSSVAEGNLALAKRAADEIGLYVQNGLGILREMAGMPSMTSMDRWNQDIIINNAKRRNAIFEKLYVLDRGGSEVVSTAFAQFHGSQAAHPAFIHASEGREYISPVFISDDRLPVITVSEPIMKFNSVVGVLEAKKKVLKRAKRGRAYVVGANGILIAHAEKRRVYAQQDFGVLDVVKDVLAGEEGHHIYIDFDGEEVIGAYAPVPMLGWGVIIQQPTEEAFLLATRMRMDVVLLILGSILLASLIALLFTRKITRPIHTLVSGAHLFSQGRLDHRIQPESNDELGALAMEFDAMAASLLENQRRLRRAERLATLSKFASIVSHEIRNPLNSMAINMQILKRELMKKGRANPEKQEKYLNIVASEIERLDTLVRNFLLIARPRELKLSGCDVNTILEEVLLSQELRAKKQRVRILRDFSPNVNSCRADRDQLKQVFLNIVLNALEAMPTGGQLKVATRLGPFGGTESRAKVPLTRRSVAVSFTDTGVGIPKEEMETIFDFYYSTKKGGTGLGLAIAQQIVEEHSGTILVESGVGKGSTFTVTIPAEAVQ
ncbi:MAG: ATP-binding protein [bacterium]